MRFSPPLQYLERGPGGEVSESPVIIEQVPSWSNPQKFQSMLSATLKIVLSLSARLAVTRILSSQVIETCLC